jgi:hypothetical protein
MDDSSGGSNWRQLLLLAMGLCSVISSGAIYEVCGFPPFVVRAAALAATMIIVLTCLTYFLVKKCGASFFWIWPILAPMVMTLMSDITKDSMPGNHYLEVGVIMLTAGIGGFSLCLCALIRIWGDISHVGPQDRSP